MKTVDRLTREQAIGAYIGMAVGDAYGAPFEFMTGDEVKSYLADIDRDWPHFFSGGSHNVIQGEWTDDTAMSRCIADSYKIHGEVCPAHVMDNFLDWMSNGEFGTRTECFDIGTTCARAIDEWHSGRIASPEMAANRLGNGGIMRLGAVICFNSQSYVNAVEDAIYSSHLTHANTLCDVYAEAVVDRCFNTGLLPDDKLHHREPVEGSGHVGDTYWNACFAFSTGYSFMDCMRICVEMGGDTDTTAAVAGMIWGSRYGVSGIPENLVDDLVDSDILLAEAECLYQLGRTGVVKNN